MMNIVIQMPKFKGPAYRGKGAGINPVTKKPYPEPPATTPTHALPDKTPITPPSSRPREPSQPKPHILIYRMQESLKARLAQERAKSGTFNLQDAVRVKREFLLEARQAALKEGPLHPEVRKWLDETILNSQ